MQTLFPPLPPYIYQTLQDIPYILQEVMPLSTKHRRELPFAIEELSTRLTSERSLLKQAYWATPRLTAAYLWYFLPWNILRLTRLFHGLKLPPPTPLPGKNGTDIKPRIFVDMGSGPLSVPLALWIAKPQWHHLPLNILCTDVAAKPLQLGQKIFEILSGNKSPWRIIPKRCPLEATSQEIHKIDGIPWLISAANVCNELKKRPGQGMDHRLFELVQKLSVHLEAEDSGLLFVEPGTRLGGKTIVDLREAGMENELWPISPCPPHAMQCPLEESKTWCHFTFDTLGAPHWLKDLSKSAHLRKEALSLAFVLLQQNFQEQEENRAARIISAPFYVPDYRGQARYACSSRGLSLILQAQSLPSGAMVDIYDTFQGRRIDKKSGAFIVEHKEKIFLNEHNIPYKSENQEQRTERKVNAFSNTSKSHTPKTDKKSSKKIKPKKNTKKFWE